jgi:hypothetical protein
MVRFELASLFRCVLVLAVSSNLVAHAAVLVVDPANGPFLTIQSAVNAAADGDLVLIESGMYAGFNIDGKGVSVIVDVDANAQINGQIVVRNLPAAASLALSRLLVQGPNAQGPENGAAVRVLDCAGHVRIEVCTLRGGNGGSLSGCEISGHPDAAPALEVMNCSDVGVTLSSLFGGFAPNVVKVSCDGFPTLGGHGGQGMRITSSTVAVYDSVLTGGAGGTAWWVGGSAGDAIVARDTPSSTSFTNVFLSNVVLDGSAAGGGAVDYFCCPTPGAGGSAIVADGGCAVRFLDSALLSGLSGANIWGTANVPAPVIEATSGATVSASSGDAKGLAIPRLLREGQTSLLTFAGNPGEACFLLLAGSMQQTYFAPLKGTLLLATPFIGPIGLGSLGPTGSIQVPIVAPALPAGIDSITVELQGWVGSGPGSTTLTSSAHLAILSASL